MCCLFMFIAKLLKIQAYAVRVRSLGTIHLRRLHDLGGEGCPHMPMVKRSQYIRIENPLHKHFAGMPMVGGEGSEIEKICRRLKWMVPYVKIEILPDLLQNVT